MAANEPAASTHRSDFSAQLIALFAFGVVFLLILLWLVFKGPPLNNSECSLVRVILGLSAAAIGAIIPGTIVANVPSIARAGGAAAFFVVVIAVMRCPDNAPTVSSPSATGPSENNATSTTTPTVSPATAQTAPVPALTLHDADQQGNPYVVVWNIDPVCHKFNPVGPRGTKLQCGLNHAQIHLDGNNTLFDKWVFGVEAPGPITSIQCNPTGTDEPVIAPYNSTTINGNSASCTGLINGGDADVTVTIKWQERW